MGSPPVVHAHAESAARVTLCGLDAVPEGEGLAGYAVAWTCPACRRVLRLLEQIDGVAVGLTEADVRTVTRAVCQGSNYAETEQAAKALLAVLKICAARP